MKRLLIVPLFFGGSLAAGTPLAAEEPEVLLLDAARAAGAEAAPLVFDRESETGAEVETDRRISGRTILLATAIASAAAVTVALLLRNRGGCRSHSSFSKYFWTWTNGVSGQWETRSDGSTVLRPGPIPVPLAAPPGGSLPNLCVAH